MNWIVLLSTLLMAAATVWSLALIWRLRDVGMTAPTIVIALMTVSRFVELERPSPHPEPLVHDLLELAISVLVVVALPVLGRSVATRRASAAAVTQSEARLRQVMDLVPHMIFAKDRDSRFLLANKALADAYGKRSEDLIGVRQGDFQLSDEELQHFLADDRAVIASGEPKFIPEEVFTDHQGNARIVETIKIPFKESGSAVPAMLGVAIDITERKRATESLQLALRELDHRVKNTLALVQSMVDPAVAASVSVESFAADFRARIYALARMHDALRETHWNELGLRELVRLAVAPYRRDGENVKTIGEPYPIAAENVQPLGMALHELAANAAKYGALSTDEGRVEVRWGAEKDDADGARLRIVWQESAGPPVSTPSRRGSGLQIIEEGLSYELGGHAEVRFEPAGVHAEITIPALAP